MPLWAWALIVVAAVLAVMWRYDRRATAHGARLNDPGSMARGVRGPQGDPEAHRRPPEGPAGSV